MNKFITLLPLIFSSYGLLAASSVDITTSDEAEKCFQKYGENNAECLEEVTDKSEHQLEKVYQDKLKAIDAFDYTQWWMADESRKTGMIDALRKSQMEWLKSRAAYCGAATTAAQGTHFLGAPLTSCTINMNKRRIAEIKMIKPEITQ